MEYVQNKKDLFARLKKMRSEALNGCVVPLATVSGVLSTKTNLVKYASCELGFDLVTTKSYQLVANPGNREPIICQPEPFSFGNSVGLRNPGIEVAVEELGALRKSLALPSILNVSLSASSAEDFVTLIKRIEHLADIVELNFSCPHASAGFGSSIGCNIEIATNYVKHIITSCNTSPALIFIKLTPNVENIGEIAKSVISAGADGIVAINTVGPALYIEPHAQAPILQNKLGGKGGKSGTWVFEKAIGCIKEIREAVGEEVPIIGMGGVSTGEGVARMLASGANVVGIGSAFGTVKQEDWKGYLEALRRDASQCMKVIRTDTGENISTNITKNTKDLTNNTVSSAMENMKKDDGTTATVVNTTSRFVITKKRMEYVSHRILDVQHISDDVMIMKCEGEMPFKAGEFVFLWLPNVGEKPFSLCLSSPITFIIKRRGAFTTELFKRKAGEIVYIRGLYGKPLVLPKTSKAILVAGGTGVALLPSLASQLQERDTQVKIYIGSSEKPPIENVENITQIPTNVIEETLVQLGTFKTVYDAGKVARVLDVLDAEIPINCSDTACYIVGPMVFMRKAASIMQAKGITKQNIFLSLEKNTMCGVGICGECSCGNRLTCQTGTFLSLAELEEMEAY